MLWISKYIIPFVLTRVPQPLNLLFDNYLITITTSLIKRQIKHLIFGQIEKKRFSTMIVEEIRSRIPPGRFLKQKSNKTGEWYDIGLKKALEKTR